MLVMLSGSVRDSSAVHLERAKLPMLFTGVPSISAGIWSVVPVNTSCSIWIPALSMWYVMVPTLSSV